VDILFVPTSSHEFVNSILDLSLYQINKIRNCINRLLDHIFVSAVIDVSKIDPLVLPEDSFHPTLEMILDIQGLEQAVLPKTASKYNQSITLNLLSVFFYDSLNSFFDQCVPRRHLVRSNKPPWFTRELSSIKNLK